MEPVLTSDSKDAWEKMDWRKDFQGSSTIQISMRNKMWTHWGDQKVSNSLREGKIPTRQRGYRGNKHDLSKGTSRDHWRRKEWYKAGSRRNETPIKARSRTQIFLKLYNQGKHPRQPSLGNATRGANRKRWVRTDSNPLVWTQPHTFFSSCLGEKEREIALFSFRFSG